MIIFYVVQTGKQGLGDIAGSAGKSAPVIREIQLCCQVIEDDVYRANIPGKPFFIRLTGNSCMNCAGSATGKISS